jgi:ADP-ribose pyrophosphatase YjhB (NUDIX family)
MTTPRDLFRHCPRCGRAGTTATGAPAFACPACGFLYYFNPALAVGAFLRGPDHRLLLLRRARDPARGRLAVPGGFVDFGESAEAALRREIREEVNLDVDELEFLCSAPNLYLYRDVTYPVVDLFFVTRARDIARLAALDDVASLAWHAAAEIDAEEFAFPSLRVAFEAYRRRSAAATADPKC